MPRPPNLHDLAAQLRALTERLEAIEPVDKLATETAQRLERHMTASNAVHQQLKSDIATLKLLVQGLLRPSP
jgi:hypothetical protein